MFIGGNLPDLERRVACSVNAELAAMPLPQSGETASSWPRGLSLGTRDVIEGLIGPLDILAGPMNSINGKLGGDPQYFQRFAPFLADALGLAKPETPGETLQSAIRQGLVSLPLAWWGGSVMMTKQSVTAVPTLTQATGRMLASTPKADVAGTVGAATAGTLARQHGAGPLGAIAAAVAGGVAGGKVGAGGKIGAGGKAAPGGAAARAEGSAAAKGTAAAEDAAMAAAKTEAKAAGAAPQVPRTYPVKTPEEFTTWVKTKPQEAYASYTERFGNKLDVDDARELCEAYGVDRAGRVANTEAVHDPSSKLINGLFEQKLKEAPGPGQRNAVTFTAGAGGSGKSTTTRNNPAILELLESSQVVYDTTFASAGSLGKVEKALAAGKDVDILYVARDPLEAIVSTFQRAQETGRYVPLDVLVKGHTDALMNIREAGKKYAGNDRVQIRVFDNTGKGSTSVKDIAFLDSLNYDNLSQRAKDALEQEFKNGKISEDLYHRILHGTR